MIGKVLKKRVFVLLLAGIMAAGMFTGCGSDQQADNSAGSGGTAPAAESSSTSPAPESGMPLVKEPVTLKIWGGETPDNDYETNVTTTEYEKMTGVHIEWKLYSNVNSNEAYNLMLASQDYPDIIAGTLSPEQVTMAVEGGIIIPLDEYIEKYGANYKKVLEEQPQYKDMLTAPDGKIYTFMYTDTGVHKDSEYKMWVYTDWLNKLNMKAPATPQEFKEMLIAFRDRDPNGNQKKDELGLMGFYNGRQSDPIKYLMNPFQLYRDNYYYIFDDKKIEFIANTEGWREGIRYLNDLYKSGLLMKETYVQDETQFKALLNKPKGETIIGAFPFWYQGAIIDSKILDWTDYEAIAPLKGPTGLQQTAARIGGNFNLNSAITASCKEPEVAFKWLDWMLSEEGSIFGMYGAEGITYEMSDQPDYNGKAPSIKTLELEKNIQLYIWNSGFFPRYDRQEIRYGTTKDDSLKNIDNTYVLLSAAKIYEPYYVNHHIPDVIWVSDTGLITQRNDDQTLFNDYIAASYTDFILGNKDINNDAEWNKYLADLDKMGLKDYLSTLEKIYLK